MTVNKSNVVTQFDSSLESVCADLVDQRLEGIRWTDGVLRWFSSCGSWV